MLKQAQFNLSHLCVRQKDEGTHLRYAKESGHSRLLDFGNSKRGSNTEFRTPKPEWVVIIRIDLSVSD